MLYDNLFFDHVLSFKNMEEVRAILQIAYN